MMICPICCHEYDGNFSSPCSCGFEPKLVDGIFSLLPEGSFKSDGFNATHFAGLFELESQNFWFKARNLIVIWVLSRFLERSSSLLEVGCGTGFVIDAISNRFPQLKLYGSDLHHEGLSFARTRLSSRVTLFQADARKLPFDAEFDVVAAFDVLEHIGEDEIVLAAFFRALTPGGMLFLTVPQHAWMWSEADDIAHHKRRYSKWELLKKVEASGFQVVETFSFVSLLLPLMWLSRLKKKSKNNALDPARELKIPSFLNAFLYGVMLLEFSCIRLGISLPFGGSRMVIAKKI